MVKSVVGDESQLKPFDDALFDSGDLPAAQVGLVVGKLRASSDRGAVYKLVPTPATDTGGPACFLSGGSTGGGGRKKGGKGSSESAPSVGIDGDWIAEHARQVSRMLLGGMDVVGIYLVSSEASFKATAPAVFWQVIKMVAQASPWSDSTLNERLLIHVSYSPRRWVCRICDVVSGTLQPCDFRYSKLLSSLQALRCTYNFKIRLPIVQAESFKNVISRAVSYLSKDVQGAKAVIDGCLFVGDMHVSSEDIHLVDLLLPLKDDVYSEGCSLEAAAGLLLFSGSVCASAYFSAKDSVSEALSDLKADIISSLRSRVDIIIDDDERNESTTGVSVDSSVDEPPQSSTCQVIFHERREYFHLPFPRRVLVPWFEGIYICDYLQPSETFEDTSARCGEMLSIDAIETSAILEPETSASAPVPKSFWDTISGNSTSDAPGPTLKPSATTERRSMLGRNPFIFAVIIALVAVLVGFVLAYRGMRSD